MDNDVISRLIPETNNLSVTRRERVNSAVNLIALSIVDLNAYCLYDIRYTVNNKRQESWLQLI